MTVVTRRALRSTLILAVTAPVLLGGGIFAGIPAAQATTGDPVVPVSASDVQELPRHYQEKVYAHELDAATPGYVLHHVHNPSWQAGVGPYTVIRTSDGTTAWTGFDATSDARDTTLAGRYFAEKVGDSTYWPTSVRFRDVETHDVAGTITVPGTDSLGAIGPGWILTAHPDSAHYPDYYVVIRRLDGTVTELPTVRTSYLAYVVGSDGTYAWVRSQFNDTLWQIDLATGAVTTVPAPTGGWSGVLVGPTQIFNVADQYDGHLTITTVDRSTGTKAVYDVVPGIGGNGPRFVTLGDGLAAWDPYHDVGSTLWKVDLDTGANTGNLGAVVADHLSDVKQGGPGQVAMVQETAVPGSILTDDGTDDGTGPETVADLPAVSETTGNVAYDGRVRATWGDDTTWSLDPEQPSDGWTKTPWTTRQKLTTSGDTSLVEDYDENNRLSTHWHLAWSGGQRDLDSDRVTLGHRGDLVVRQTATDPNTGAASFDVERVRTGEVVATAGDEGAVADGSWVWHVSAPGVLTGTDVDHPGTPARTVDVSSAGTNTVLMDVRGRWALMYVYGGTRVFDTLGVVAPFPVPGGGFNPPAPTQLGAGFVVSTTWTYDAYGHYNGQRTIVTDLSATHESRDLIDPDSGRPTTRFRVDEAGSRTLAYVDWIGLPKVLRLPWLHDAPLTKPDTAAPTLTDVSGTGALVRSTTPVTVHDSWTFTDQVTTDSPASGVASTSVRWRTRTGAGAYGAWTTTTGAPDQADAMTATAALDRAVSPGQELCAQANATDVAGNTTAWTTERCTRVDGKAPVLAAATGSARFTVPDTFGEIRYGFHAVDDVAVDSYDVQVRSAAPGVGLGGWSTLKAATTATSLKQPVRAGSEWCFRFRARDTAGNVSGWSTARCSSVAIQDSSFYSPGDSLRRQSRLALDGWFTRLNYPNAWLRLRHTQVGHTVAVWAIAGPGQGTADIFAGGVRVGRVSLASSTSQRRLLTFPMTRNGLVKVVQHGTKPVGIDAITVER